MKERRPQRTGEKTRARETDVVMLSPKLRPARAASQRDRRTGQPQGAQPQKAQRPVLQRTKAPSGPSLDGSGEPSHEKRAHHRTEKLTAVHGQLTVTGQSGVNGKRSELGGAFLTDIADDIFSAVDADHVARHPARIFVGEEHQRLRDVFRRGQASAGILRTWRPPASSRRRGSSAGRACP